MSARFSVSHHVLPILLAALLAVQASAALAKAATVPSPEQVRDAYLPSDVMLLDRNGQPLQQVRVDYQQRRGNWVHFDEISPALLQAVLQSEDQRFWSHGGVDMLAIAGALRDRVLHGVRRGASTITMQLAGLISPELQRTKGGRNLGDKWKQAMAARQLEQVWRKPQILEAYLNLAAFRGEIVGIDALSRTLFRKQPSGLDFREAALAAVLLRGPNVPMHQLQARTCALWRQLEEMASCQGLDAFITNVLSRHGAWDDVPRQAPHFARMALSARAGQVVSSESLQTTIDGGLQQFVMESINRHLYLLNDANVRDAAVVVMENTSGEILAYAGSSGSQWSSAAAVDHALARRQAGSALKPFLYALALDQQRITAASLLNDSPLSLQTGSGIYLPGNYDGGYAGWVSARTALASSLNIPAVRVLTMVTPDAFHALLVRLGLDLTRESGYYGYSLALGSADVTLLSLTNAYRALANGGIFSRWTMTPRAAVAPGVRVLSEPATWIVGDILSDRHARSRTFGLDSPLSTPFWTAVKTGTSKDMRDNWSLGWSDRYVVGVWVGNSEGASMQDVSGVSGAGPIWLDIMRYLHRRQASLAPEPVEGIIQQYVSFEGVQEPARVEAFLGDTAISTVRLSLLEAADQPFPVSIRLPVDGTILALDPDIPLAHQKVRFQADGILDDNQVGKVQWVVNDTVEGHGAQWLWTPRPGKHRIQLLDRQGRRLDAITIQVRAPARG